MLKESFDPSVDEQEGGCWSRQGAGFLCQPFITIIQDLLQRMAQVSWLMQLSSWYGSKGYKEVRL